MFVSRLNSFENNVLGDSKIIPAVDGMNVTLELLNGTSCTLVSSLNLNSTNKIGVNIHRTTDSTWHTQCVYVYGIK